MARIIFVLGQISQPRCLKRIESIKLRGYEVVIWGFDYSMYNINLNTSSLNINRFDFKYCKTEKLRNFIKRRNCIARLIRSSNKDDLFYFFGFDVAFLAILSFFHNRYIYEESDITYASRNIFLFYFLKFIDSVLRKNSLLTIMTSGGFADFFYKDGNIPNNIVIQPNKLHPSLKNSRRISKLLTTVSNLKFGFIGLIRYKTIFNFARVIGEFYPNHEFHFWGSSWQQEEVDKIDKLYDNVYSHGEFRNPNDLESVYSQIDILVVCYDVTNFNTKVAEPNKLYEAIFFCKPIIVSKNTYIERKVLDMGIGYSLDASNYDSIRVLIDGLKLDKLNEIIQTEEKQNINLLIDNSESISDAINKWV